MSLGRAGVFCLTLSSGIFLDANGYLPIRQMLPLLKDVHSSVLVSSLIVLFAVNHFNN